MPKKHYQKSVLKELKSAIRKNDNETIEKLLSSEVDVNPKFWFRNETNIIEYAIENGSQESAMLLAQRADQMKKGSSHGILFRAVTRDKPILVEWLIEKGFDLNISSSYGSLLHKAASSEVAEILLANGLSLEAKDKYGYRPLNAAVSMGHVDVVATFIKHGADVNSADKDGYTTLFNALLDCEDFKSGMAIMKLLIANGANVNAKLVSNGSSLLHLLDDPFLSLGALSGLANIVEYVMMEYDVDIDARDNEGRTPLFNVHSLALVEKYLSRGADINIVDHEGLTPLETACKIVIGCDRCFDVHIEGEQRFSAVILVKHIIKLKTSGFYVSKKNLDCAEFIVRANNVRGQPLDENLENYDRVCALELNKLKMNLCISPKSFLTSRYPSYLLNAERSRKLEEMSDDDYPIYGPIIRNKFKRDKNIFKLSEPCKILLSRSQLKPTLPDEIWGRIVSYLTKTDLRGFA